ncbi:MAG: hypothetical protein WBC70_04725 [Candidatus Aminicenantales bacterium]
MKKTILIFAVFMVALALGLIGAPENKKPSSQVSAVPPDSQWALHIDMQRLTSSTMFKGLLEENGAAKMKVKADQFLGKLKIDPLKDLKGITVFGRDKKNEDAVVALKGKFDRAHLLGLIKAEESHKEIPYGKSTIYCWDGDDFGAFAADDLILLSESEEAVKAALDTLEGKKKEVSAFPFLARVMKDSPNAIFSAAVSSVSGLMGEKGRPVILSKIREAGGSFSESGENAVLNVSISAESAQVARDVEQAIRGLLAMANLQLADTEAQALAQSIKIEVDGERVRINASYPAHKLMGLARGRAKGLSVD